MAPVSKRKEYGADPKVESLSDCLSLHIALILDYCEQAMANLMGWGKRLQQQNEDANNTVYLMKRYRYISEVILELKKRRSESSHHERVDLVIALGQAAFQAVLPVLIGVQAFADHLSAANEETTQAA